MRSSDWCARSSQAEIGPFAVRVSELRMRDRVALEDFVAAALGSPIDALDPEAPDYADQLRSAYDVIAAGPPEFGEPRANAVLFGTPGGIAFFLAVALREMPGLLPEDFRELAETIEAPELSRIIDLAGGIPRDERSEIIRLIDDHLGLPAFAPRVPLGGDRITMAEAVGDAVLNLPWADPERIMDLTISQWVAVRSGGKSDEEGDPLPEDSRLADEVCAARREFFGIPDDEPEAPETEGEAIVDDPFPEPPE